MRGENPPRAHGGWSRAQVWCPFCSRCSPAIGRPGYRGGGLSAPPPLLAAAPSPLSAREWMEERTSAQRCSNSDRLTDWLTLLCPVKPGLWLGEATSTCWLTVANTDTYSWSSEWGWSWKHGRLGREDVFRSMLWNEECRSANFSPQPLLYRRLLPSGVWSSRTDFHRSSSLSCQTAAPWLLSSGHWYYRSRAILSISVWLTYLLQGKTRVKWDVELLKQKRRYSMALNFNIHALTSFYFYNVDALKKIQKCSLLGIHKSQ